MKSTSLYIFQKKGERMTTYKNPVPTVDIIIEVINLKNSNEKQFVLIKRKNPPYGWAIPGGFVDYGETLEQAAVREALEETGLAVELVRQFHAYSDPTRDARLHTITTVYIAKATGIPKAADDALSAELFTEKNIPEDMAFDHKKIISDYLACVY